MRFSLTSLLRLIVILAMGSSAAAIGLSRLTPPTRAWKTPTGITYVNVSASLMGIPNENSAWLDMNRGELTTLALPRDEALHYASCSPWQDQNGRAQAVGLWTNLGGECRSLTDYGLARYSFPDGELLDLIRTEKLPVSPPAWYPGTRARVVFAAGDGRLFECDFESGGATATVEPRAIAWSCIPPGHDGVILTDPHWSTDSRMGRTLLVSLRQREERGGRTTLSSAKIWWLKLSETGHEIESAGPLTESSEESARVEERCPTAGRGPRGELVLAYQSKLPGEPWKVRVAPLSMNTKSREPQPVAAPARTLVTGCLPMPAAFSLDGRWVGAIHLLTGKEAVLRRISLESTGDQLSALSDPFRLFR